MHPHPRNACVVGLGTGSTAGWLADAPGMERVDVLELEQEVRKVAGCFNSVSRNAMRHPRVRQITGDAREFLLTRGENYDLIVSEPSNPCRAGVANLYTREFYANANQRLNEGGIFCQWLQGYEVEEGTVNTVIATLCQVFPKVEVWTTKGTDMLLICGKENTPWSLESIRHRVKQEPLAEALRSFWETDTAEGFLAACIANSDFCAALAKTSKTVNTDDFNHLEFSFARSVARKANCSRDLARAATRAGCFLPKLDAPVDGKLYLSERLHVPVRLWNNPTSEVLPLSLSAAAAPRLKQLNSFCAKRYQEFLTAPEPASPVLADRILRAHAKARMGTADAVASRLKLTQQLAAVESLGKPYPWAGPALVLRVKAFAQAKDPRLGMVLAEMTRFLDEGGTTGAESPPFAVKMPPLPATATEQRSLGPLAAE